MGPREPTKENAQLNRQNDFSFTEIKLVYCLTRKTLWCNSLVQKICIFLRKEISPAEAARRWFPGDPSTIFLASIFTQKMQKSSDSMYSSIFMLENIIGQLLVLEDPN